MNQDEINLSEWNMNENWGGPRWGEVYFSKKASRIFVPKRLKWMGMTVNLAHTAGVLLFIGFLFEIPFLKIWFLKS